MFVVKRKETGEYLTTIRTNGYYRRSQTCNCDLQDARVFKRRCDASNAYPMDDNEIVEVSLTLV